MSEPLTPAERVAIRKSTTPQNKPTAETIQRLLDDLERCQEGAGQLAEALRGHAHTGPNCWRCAILASYDERRRG